MGTPWLTDCAPELDFFPSSKQAVCHCVHRASNVQLSFSSRIINCLAEVQDFIAVSAIGPELTRFARFVSRAILDPTSQPTPALECRGGWENQLLPARPGQFFVAKATSLWEHFRDRDDEPVNGARSSGRDHGSQQGPNGADDCCKLCRRYGSEPYRVGGIRIRSAPSPHRDCRERGPAG